MKICVLNSSNPINVSLESDFYVDYRTGRASCFNGQERVKQSTSWHSLPYSLETEFFVYNKDKWQGCLQYDAVIVLVNRDISAVMPLVKKLKLMKKKVAISFHEGVQDLLGGSGVPGEDVMRRWVELSALVKEADFYMNIFGQMTPFFEGWFGKDKVRFCSHGAPIDWDHGFTIPWQDRPYDVLVGTRTLNQRLSRNTLVSLGTLNGLAKENNLKVYYLSEDGDVSGLLKSIGMNNMSVIRGPLSWIDWLRFIAKFKVLAHFDQSMNLGQICYDAAMVDVMPIGSTNWNNMLIQTDDHGDLYDFKYFIELIFKEKNHEYEMIWRGLSDFKKNIHPDKVRANLIEMFKS